MIYPYNAYEYRSLIITIIIITTATTTATILPLIEPISSTEL